MADIVAAAALALVLPPMILVVAALSYRPNLPLILRRQYTAQHGQQYTVYEFNAEHRNVDARGDAAHARPLHPLIRLCRGDQLPQLLNVIRGDLTFFGAGARPRLFAD